MAYFVGRISDGGIYMILKLSEQDILRICEKCPNYKGDHCIDQDKPISEVRRCSEWDKVYRDKCIRQR